MQITSVTARNDATATAVPATGTATVVARQKVLGQADFLKLLATQFQQQDPMKPVDDTAFIAQMAQFSSLEQTAALVAQMTQLRINQDLASANSYIGRRVTFDLGKGLTTSGTVTGVKVTAGAPALLVGDQAYALSAVLGISPGAVATAPVTLPSVTRTGP
jgi:flagellar basal-body rod modification protein FlgD